jgi:hypothetical protein
MTASQRDADRRIDVRTDFSIAASGSLSHIGKRLFIEGRESSE